MQQSTVPCRLLAAMVFSTAANAVFEVSIVITSAATLAASIGSKPEPTPMSMTLLPTAAAVIAYAYITHQTGVRR